MTRVSLNVKSFNPFNRNEKIFIDNINSILRYFLTKFL